jgi:hypothetical protein
MRISTSANPESQPIHEIHPAEGQYHCQVNAVKSDPDQWCITFNVITGTVPGQKGYTFRETVWLNTYQTNDLNPVSLKKIGRLVWACGLQKGGEESDFAGPELEGCQCVVTVFHKNKDNDAKQTWPNVSWKHGGVWPLGHAEVVTVPQSGEHAKTRKQSHTPTVAADDLLTGL